MDKTYNWNSDKNQQLITERDICFEDVVLNINLGNELDIYDHPNKERYPNQQVSVVRIEDYVYLVPFVENDNEIFFKNYYSKSKGNKTIYR